jgi:hypothetical protein
VITVRTFCVRYFFLTNIKFSLDKFFKKAIPGELRNQLKQAEYDKMMLYASILFRPMPPLLEVTDYCRSGFSRLKNINIKIL